MKYLILAAMAGCSVAPTGKEEIRALLADQVDSWNRGNIAGYMNEYWKSDSLRFASDETTVFGWQTVLERYQFRYSDTTLMGKLEFSNVDIEMLGNDAALVFGHWVLRRVHDKPAGLFTLILRKVGGEWKIVHDHTSSGKQ